MRIIGMVLLCLTLIACETRKGLAPVTELTWRPQQAHAQFHRVRDGETLYAVAFLYDQDYQKLAQYNHLRPPYHLLTGQRLRLVPATSVRQPRQREAAVHFVWPVQGRVIRGFSPSRGRKGIEIQAMPMMVVKAAAPGIVAYAGNGIGGYGELIILKHANQMLTAYGNNAVYVVKEGQHVSSGQVIGKVGHLDRQRWGLHFEIRQAGKPLNPLIYLRNR